MYVAILRTYYQIFATGKTLAEAKRNIVTGYKDTYPPESREFEKPDFEDLDHFYGCPIYKIDPKKGYTVE